jgi:predicted TPR repeat methyltransferase
MRATLCYFGDLDPLAEGMSRVMRHGGRLVFDVEKGEGTEPTFHVSGRFAHPVPVLRRIFIMHDFTFNAIQEGVMRNERGAAVTGLSCALTRS